MAKTPEEQALFERWRSQTEEDGGDSRSLSEQVHRTLADAIVDRALPAGWRLSEERLGGLFAVSRTPVREALAALSGSKLAYRDDRGKLRVAGVTREQILHVYQVRSMLEALSAKLAAETATPRMIMRLKELNAACVAAAEREDFIGLANANIAFHGAIADCTDNELLVQFIDDVHTWVKRFPTTTLAYPGRAEHAMAEHAALLEAIEAHDAQRAEEIARQHMRAAEEIRFAMFRDVSAQLDED